MSVDEPWMVERAQLAELVQKMKRPEGHNWLDDPVFDQGVRPLLVHRAVLAAVDFRVRAQLVYLWMLHYDFGEDELAQIPCLSSMPELRNRLDKQHLHDSNWPLTLEIIAELGWIATFIHGYDDFPRTVPVETLGHLERTRLLKKATAELHCLLARIDGHAASADALVEDRAVLQQLLAWTQAAHSFNRH